MAFPCCLHISLSPTVHGNSQPHPLRFTVTFSTSHSFRVPHNLRHSLHDLRPGRNINASLSVKWKVTDVQHAVLKRGNVISAFRCQARTNKRQPQYDLFSLSSPVAKWLAIRGAVEGSLFWKVALFLADLWLFEMVTSPSMWGSSHRACVCKAKNEMFQKQPYGWVAFTAIAFFSLSNSTLE